MPIDAIPGWEARLARQDAFWDRAILDRPVVHIEFPRSDPARPWPDPARFASHRDRWLDVDFQVESALAYAANTEFHGDALPRYWPNLGPEVFSAFFGQALVFGADTSWSEPCLDNWEDAGQLQFSEDNSYWRRLNQMTDALLDAGQGKYYTGLTDFHPGGDAIAAFRDPMRLNLDLLTNPQDVKRLLSRVTATFLGVYDLCFKKLRENEQAITTWAGLVSTRKWYVPSNDFSCMISPEMFQEFFLPGIVDECQHLDAAIYHLDGPGALRHLDALLEVPGINAIQWIYGAGHGRASDWLPVYGRCQQAGKGIQLWVDLDEIGAIMANLRPQGVWMGIHGIRDQDSAAAVLQELTKWR